MNLCFSLLQVPNIFLHRLHWRVAVNCGKFWNKREPQYKCGNSADRRNYRLSNSIIIAIIRNLSSISTWHFESIIYRHDFVGDKTKPYIEWVQAVPISFHKNGIILYGNEAFVFTPISNNDMKSFLKILLMIKGTPKQFISFGNYKRISSIHSVWVLPKCHSFYHHYPGISL